MRSASQSALLGPFLLLHGWNIHYRLFASSTGAGRRGEMEGLFMWEGDCWWEETRAACDGPKGHRCSLPMISLSRLAKSSWENLFLGMLAEVLQQQLAVDVWSRLWKVLRHMYLRRIFAPAQRIEDSHDYTTRLYIKVHGSTEAPPSENMRPNHSSRRHRPDLPRP